MDANELKPIAIDSVPLGVPAASGAFCVSDSSERDAYQVNHGGNQTTNNLFLQFLARTRYNNSNNYLPMDIPFKFLFLVG